MSRTLENLQSLIHDSLHQYCTNSDCCNKGFSPELLALPKVVVEQAVDKEEVNDCPTKKYDIPDPPKPFDKSFPIPSNVIQKRMKKSTTSLKLEEVDAITSPYGWDSKNVNQNLPWDIEQCLEQKNKSKNLGKDLKVKNDDDDVAGGTGARLKTYSSSSTNSDFGFWQSAESKRGKSKTLKERHRSHPKQIARNAIWSQEPKVRETVTIFECPLCYQSNFSDLIDLQNHIDSKHPEISSGEINETHTKNSNSKIHIFEPEKTRETESVNPEKNWMAPKSKPKSLWSTIPKCQQGPFNNDDDMDLVHICDPIIRKSKHIPEQKELLKNEIPAISSSNNEWGAHHVKQNHSWSISSSKEDEFY